MNNAIRNFRTIHNNVFILSPIFIHFFKEVGPKPKSILLSYLVLPFVLPLGSRKSLVNSNVTSTVFSCLGKKKCKGNPSERLEDDLGKKEFRSGLSDHAPQLVPVLMTREIFDLHPHSAVPEKAPASEPPVNLTVAETSLYRHLPGSSNGRLEQEFLPVSSVHHTIEAWGTKNYPSGNR